jgi:hypothetical protein
MATLSKWVGASQTLLASRRHCQHVAWTALQHGSPNGNHFLALLSQAFMAFDGELTPCVSEAQAYHNLPGGARMMGGAKLRHDVNTTGWQLITSPNKSSYPHEKEENDVSVMHSQFFRLWRWHMKSMQFKWLCSGMYRNAFLESTRTLSLGKGFSLSQCPTTAQFGFQPVECMQRV